MSKYSNISARTYQRAPLKTPARFLRPVSSLPADLCKCLRITINLYAHRFKIASVGSTRLAVNKSNPIDISEWTINKLITVLGKYKVQLRKLMISGYQGLEDMFFAAVYAERALLYYDDGFNYTVVLGEFDAKVDEIKKSGLEEKAEKVKRQDIDVENT